jgi:UDP-N-acetylglucosamine/UDP-N-acetylgalactosamine diphosphorylase
VIDELNGLEFHNKHPLGDLSLLSEEEKMALLDQIKALDVDTLKEQQALVKHPKVSEENSFDPYLDYQNVEECPFDEVGLKALKEGLMGCIVVAGGQASRLGLGNTPKGKCPVSVAKNKTLFQLFAEKTACASKFCGKKLSIAFMTSPLNDEETKTYFKEHNYFGLNEDQIDFYCQSQLPFLDDEGHLFLESKDKLALGPNGNGEALKKFYTSGLWQKWSQRGIKYVNFILIDNSLADPFDLFVLGALVTKSCDVVIKAVERQDANEKVGVIVKEAGTIKIVEYSELLESEKTALGKDKKLKHLLANISLFGFSMDFIERVAFLKAGQVPLHAVKKKVKKIDEENFWAWKFERFIFDLLPFASNTFTIVYPRSQTFAPLKNFTGQDSIKSVQEALARQDKKIYFDISGVKPSEQNFELAQDFYYPTEELKKKWRGRALAQNLYIEP